MSRLCHGGVEKRGGWKTSRMTPLPKRGFGPPLVRYVFHPPQVSVLCFSCTKIHDRADQKLFWRGPKIFGRARSLVRFPPPIRFAPPHITGKMGPFTLGDGCWPKSSMLKKFMCCLSGALHSKLACPEGKKQHKHWCTCSGRISARRTPGGRTRCPGPRKSMLGPFLL